MDSYHVNPMLKFTTWCKLQLVLFPLPPLFFTITPFILDFFGMCHVLTMFLYVFKLLRTVIYSNCQNSLAAYFDSRQWEEEIGIKTKVCSSFFLPTTYSYIFQVSSIAPVCMMGPKARVSYISSWKYCPISLNLEVMCHRPSKMLNAMVITDIFLLC